MTADPIQRAREILADAVEAEGYEVLSPMLRNSDFPLDRLDAWIIQPETAVKAIQAALLTREEEARGEERAATVAYLRAFGSGLAEATSSDYDLQFMNAAGDLIKLMGDCIEQDAHHTHAPAIRADREGVK